MRLIPFLLFISLSVAAFGQLAEPPTRRVALGVSVSPDLGYRVLRATGSDTQLVSMRNHHEVPAFGYTAGLNMVVPVGKRVSVESGLLFTSKRFSTRTQALGWSEPNEAFPAGSNTSFRYQYLHLPLTVSYSSNQGRFGWFVLGGLAIDMFISQTTQVTDIYVERQASTASTKYIGVNRYNGVWVASGGATYRLVPKVTMRLAPVCRYALSPLRPALPLREHLYSVGMMINLHRTM